MITTETIDKIIDHMKQNPKISFSEFRDYCLDKLELSYDEIMTLTMMLLSTDCARLEYIGR